MSLITASEAANPAEQDGGRGGIRTHGGFPHARFRVECLKPDSATLPCRKKNVEPAYAKSFGVASAERPTQVSRRRSCLRGGRGLLAAISTAGPRVGVPS